jgi:hypothetical protein
VVHISIAANACLVESIVMDKLEILDAIKRLAEENGGSPPGQLMFERATGVKKSDWYPYLWLRWGEALVEAGYIPNQLMTAISDSVLITRWIELARELGRVPVEGEIRRKGKTDKSFPSHTVFRKLGGKEALLEAVRRWCRQHPGHEDIIALCAEDVTNPPPGKGANAKVPTGFVYLMKSGRHYKIGHTISVGRREREFAIQIPVPPKTVHTIETDDPVGVEAYWHQRFRDKRGEGEWFELSPEDVRAFRRWRRIV